MTKEEKNAFRFWRKFYLIVLIVAIIAICLCSCDEVAQDGIVSTVEEASTLEDYYKYKVQVKKFIATPAIDGGNYYWFWTNDTLMVGDTIHIGKVN